MWRTAGKERAAPAPMPINASGTPMSTQKIRRRMLQDPEPFARLRMLTVLRCGSHFRFWPTSSVAGVWPARKLSGDKLPSMPVEHHGRI
jgi:hypothetical protein